jgi:hypothetical protein
MLSGTRLSSSVSLNRLSHQQRRIDRARARLDDQPHILGRLVAHVGNERQLFRVQQFRDLLDQAGFLHQPGESR